MSAAHSHNVTVISHDPCCFHFPSIPSETVGSEFHLKISWPGKERPLPTARGSAWRVHDQIWQRTGERVRIW